MIKQSYIEFDAKHPYNKRRCLRSLRLECNWYSWRAVDTGHLALELPADNCCDMTGAIRTALFLCPSVGRIDVFAGGELDVVYLSGRIRYADGRPRSDNFGELGWWCAIRDEELSHLITNPNTQPIAAGSAGSARSGEPSRS